MCLNQPKMPAPAAAPLIAAYDNTEALRQADMEASLRRRRRGAAVHQFY